MPANSESRSNHRRFANMTCSIIPAQREVSIPARIYNLSETGAAIEVNVFGKLPDVIGVEVDGRIYTAKVMWRRSKNIGVRFIHEP